MISTHKCDACERPISQGMYFNGIRLKGIALCLVCQCVKNIVDEGEEKAKMYNDTLILQFGVTNEQIEAKKQLPYWKEQLS